jgi:hemerythrin-like domain-containing protein
MIQLPNPDDYEDPIRYFRDCHKLIVGIVDRFEKLVTQAQEKGVAVMFAESGEWEEILNFFVAVAPMHELEEERTLFPIILEKVHHIGFQSPLSPSRFIHEQHDVMQERSKALIALWRGYMLQKELNATDEARFLEVAIELIRLYREHVGVENSIIYSAANDELLTPAERIGILLALQGQHGNQTVTQVISFDDQPYTDNSESSDDGSSSDVVSPTRIQPTDWDDGEEEDDSGSPDIDEIVS